MWCGGLTPLALAAAGAALASILGLHVAHLAPLAPALRVSLAAAAVRAVRIGSNFRCVAQNGFLRFRSWSDTIIKPRICQYYC